MAAKKSPGKTSPRTMPAFTKPTQATVNAFEIAFARTPGGERRTMFGYPSAFLNGNMMACVFQDRIMVRLSELDRADAQRAHGGKPFEPSPGRAMKEYIELPASITKDGDALAPWFARASAYVTTLPGRAKKPVRANARQSSAAKTALKSETPVAKKSTKKSAAKRKSR